MGLSQARVNLNAIIDINEPNHYCAQRKKHMSSGGSFKKHIRRIHRLLLPNWKQKMNKDVISLTWTNPNLVIPSAQSISYTNLISKSI